MISYSNSTNNSKSPIYQVSNKRSQTISHQNFSCFIILYSSCFNKKFDKICCKYCEKYKNPIIAWSRVCGFNSDNKIRPTKRFAQRNKNSAWFGVLYSCHFFFFITFRNVIGVFFKSPLRLQKFQVFNSVLRHRENSAVKYRLNENVQKSVQWSFFSSEK